MLSKSIPACEMLKNESDQIWISIFCQIRV